MLNKNAQIIALVGPTAVGKTALSLAAAHHFNAEIISVDSRQVFKETSIGTAKPTADELSKATHHFIDEKSLSDDFSAGIFAREATDRITQITEKGKNVLLVGGSTLYLQALLFGLSNIPDTDPAIRQKLSRRLKAEGAAVLFEELQTVDPELAAKVDRFNGARLVRGLEVFYSSGRPLSEWHKDDVPPAVPHTMIVLDRERQVLYDRINLRVDLMMSAGLMKEVEQIIEAGFDPNLSALKTIGYQEPIAFLQGEIKSFDTMVELLKRNSRRYAKRQQTWYRRYKHANWLHLGEITELDQQLLFIEGAI